jgi:hypothetical protein
VPLAPFMSVNSRIMKLTIQCQDSEWVE